MTEPSHEATLRRIERDPQPTHSIRITADRILVAQPGEVGERWTRERDVHAVASERVEGTTGLYL